VANVTAGQTGYVDEAFAFTGRWLDKATGLQNNLNRWYDSNTGRWLSEDPIGFRAGDANLYRYVGNEPTRYTDPSGLWRWFGWVRKGGCIKEWWSGWWPTAADAVVEEANPISMGTASGALEAGAGATAAASVLIKHKRYFDLQNNTKARECDVEKAYHEWQDAQEKLLKLQRENR
jgi:RHS repeat-associated protein